MADSKMTEALNDSLDALIAMEDWLAAEEAISRSAYKGDSRRLAVVAHGNYLAAKAKGKLLIEKRRLSKNG